MSPVALEQAGRLLNRGLSCSEREDEREGEYEVIRHEIEEIVQTALHASGFHELRRIEVFSLEGHVTLHGTVSNYYLKQVAQTVAYRQSGVGSLANRIRVARPITSGAADGNPS